MFLVTTGDVDESDLHKSVQGCIRQKLNPLFKVERVVCVESLPRTASNKVMRRKLREMVEDESH
jgi:acetyl-CoA synthetase